MASGKTTFGQELAKILKYKFIDLDKEIEKNNKLTIKEIFDKFGEKKFREIEKKTLQQITTINNIVISTGGGTPCFHKNMTLMNNCGTTIFLNTNPETIFKRLKTSTKRPLINTKNDYELKQQIQEMLAERTEYYNMANIKINPDTTDIQQLIQTLNINQP